MADIIDQFTPTQLRDILRGFMSAFVLAETGDVWDATDARRRRAALVFEAMARYISDERTEFNGLANDLLPGPDSPYLTQMVALLGITPEAGESNASLWTRRALALQQASLGSPVALEDLLTGSVAGVTDVGFITQPDGSQNVYLVSSLAPPSGTEQGTPTPEQNAAALALVNGGRARHIGRPFAVVAPTATLYSIVLTVSYLSAQTPVLGDLQSAVATAIGGFVVASRKLGETVDLSNLYVAASVAGVDHVDGDFYTDDLTMSNPVPLEELDPADASVFYTCAETVNNVDDLASATTGQINLIWEAL